MSTQPPDQPTTTASDSAGPGPDVTPYWELVAIAFPTVAHGVLVADACDPPPAGCRILSSTSEDSGRTWSSWTTIASKDWLSRDDYARPGVGVTRLAFTNAMDGLAYGPDLYATHDGGHTWRAVLASARVSSVDALTQPPLLILGGCVSSNDCQPLQLARLDGDRVLPAPAQDKLGATELVPADAHTAYALGGPGVAETRDGGRTWVQHAAPDECFRQSLSAVTARDLWLVCAEEWAAGTQRKRLWRSPDGGVTWRGPLPAEFAGYATTVVATGAQSAWRFGGRAPLFRTEDGGRSWHEWMPVGFNDGGGVPRGFAAIGPDRAWILDPGGLATGPQKVYSTVDAGRSWRAIEVPQPA